MENVFGKYSKFYDLLYRAKDYVIEAKYIEDIVKKHGIPNSKNLIDLGCGTGSHSIIWAKNGWSVTGVDRSESMLQIARTKTQGKNLGINFFQGDLSNFKLKEESYFDVAVSMFAVVGYLIENKSLQHLFSTVRKILKPGGLFIFDSWFGPAVLTDIPTDKYKFNEENGVRVIRFTHPEMHSLKNVIDINFHVIEIREEKIQSEVKETHPMRFFFAPEIQLLFNQVGLDLVAIYPFMKLSGRVNEKDWNVVFVGKKRLL